MLRCTRRSFSALAAASLFASDPRYTIGITTNTRGGWENDVWLSFREARETGYRWVESFISYFVDYWDKPEELQKKIDALGVKLITISNSSPMEMHFEDPARHEKLLADHLRLGKFIRHFGCRHLKINLGPRRETGTTQQDLQHMSTAVEELGRQLKGIGVRLAIHAHMWSQFENRREIDFVLSHTTNENVGFVLDTGHITLAGIDPVELTRTLGHRIVEFHLKDTAPETRGGAKKRLPRPDMMKEPCFFPLGHGGVDFPAIKAHLDRIAWKGFLTVELDSSPYRPPKESARMSLRYLKETLKLA
ncbi:MAG: sugar phosphate isomerase/epimerase [Bryobacteraceae bacterium]|nr:sugar phosphate isomerase/epimerase [Bryobacteraceae bacterium]MDW8380426.1 sugar phosphate isomerase/epimerase [Bryobacterales bacterium]